MRNSAFTPGGRDATRFPFSEVRLGDLVVMPDQQTLTVRGKAVLSETVGTVSGFLVLGEMDSLLAAPSRDGFPLLWFHKAPLDAPAGRIRARCEGVFRYWAPHAPALTTAMGEVSYRVFEEENKVDPSIVLFRSGEPIRFVRSTSVDPTLVSRIAMNAEEQTGNLRRQSWIVRPTPLAPDTVPDHIPAHEPVPEHVTAPSRWDRSFGGRSR